MLASIRQSLTPGCDAACSLQEPVIGEAWQDALKQQSDQVAEGWRALALADVVLERVEPPLLLVVGAGVEVADVQLTIVHPVVCTWQPIVPVPAHVLLSFQCCSWETKLKSQAR